MGGWKSFPSNNADSLWGIAEVLLKTGPLQKLTPRLLKKGFRSHAVKINWLNNSICIETKSWLIILFIQFFMHPAVATAGCAPQNLFFPTESKKNTARKVQLSK